MTDKIDKALEKLSKKEKAKLKELLFNLEKGALSNIDIKKLKGRDDIFRVRKGGIRIIFRKIDDKIKILSLECRSDKTYK